MQSLLKLLLFLLEQELLLKDILLELLMIIVSWGTSLKILCKINVSRDTTRRWLLVGGSGGIFWRILFATDRPINFDVCSPRCLFWNLDLLFAWHRLKQRSRPLARHCEQIRRCAFLSRPIRINLIKLLQLTRTCLCYFLKHSLQIIIMWDVRIRDNSIETWTSHFLWLCENGVIYLLIFGDFNQSTRAHLGTRSSDKELIILNVDEFFVATIQRTTAQV